jgi:mannose-6-phosphate isomerase-like protein (cupin superfamily)
MTITHLLEIRRRAASLQGVCCFVLSVAALYAQTPPIPHAFIPGVRLDALEQKLKAELAVTADKTAAVNAVPVPEVTKYRTLMGHRDAPAPGEAHEDLSDFGIVRSGSALLRYGGTLVNRTMPTPGEPRGTGLEGFKTIQVAAGDLLYIPAGMPHQFVPDPGKPLTFLLFKPSGLKPADRPGELMHWSAARLDSMTKELAGHLDELKGANIALVAAGTNPPDRRVLMGYREGPGVGESHQRFAEFVFVRKGSGTVTLGGKIVNGKLGELGETVGTAVEGGTRQAFTAGDLIHIAENTPHRFAPDQGKSFNVVLFRFPSQ